METFCVEFVSFVFSVYICGMSLELNGILKKVSSLYNRYGIRSITMDDVARELCISKKTLYQFVSDKEDLVEKVLMYEIGNRPPLDNGKKSRNAIEDLFEVHGMINRVIRETNPSKEYDLQKYYPEINKKIVDIKRDITMRAMMYNIKKGKKEGLYRKELNETIISKMYLLRMNQIVMDDAEAIKEYTSSKFILEMFIYHIRGMATQKGIEFLDNNIDKLMHE